ncbi:hypothetical protein [Pedobacter sp. B4-66]|uniref:hypothetical protein n=1 Tax=Pedobacter sp. B4-66 TaxID=2817280 RepID=UPI001BDB5C12|nr:hypothetical protein [Pedobacter sp. B4-66]
MDKIQLQLGDKDIIITPVKGQRELFSVDIDRIFAGYVDLSNTDREFLLNKFSKHEIEQIESAIKNKQ